MTLAQPVPATRFATLFIWGNQALDDVDRRAGNGTGASVAEWAIFRAAEGGGGYDTAGRGGGEGKFRVRGVGWLGE